MALDLRTREEFVAQWLGRRGEDPEVAAIVMEAREPIYVSSCDENPDPHWEMVFRAGDPHRILPPNAS